MSVIGAAGCPAKPATTTTVGPATDEASLMQAEVRVFAGGERTCVLQAGKVACWGGGAAELLLHDGFGELARAMDGFDRTSADGMEVVPIDDAADLVVGSGHLCALRSDGRVRCWASADAGYTRGIGDGVPTRAAESDVLNLSDASGLSTGDMTTCATRREGPPVCWGVSPYGLAPEAENGPAQLGPAQMVWSVPFEIPGIGGGEHLAISGDGVCAIDDGTVRCTPSWRGATTPEFGSGVQLRSLALQSSSPGGCAALADGTVACFSDGESAANPVPGIHGVRQLSTSVNGYCALHGEGEVGCWGYEEGAIVNLETALPLRPAEHLAVGAMHLCVGHGGGAVSCLGDDGRGQLHPPRRPPALEPALSGADGLFTTREGICARQGEGATCRQPTDPSSFDRFEPVMALHGERLWSWEDPRGDDPAPENYVWYRAVKPSSTKLVGAQIDAPGPVAWFTPFSRAGAIIRTVDGRWFQRERDSWLALPELAGVREPLSGLECGVMSDGHARCTGPLAAEKMFEVAVPKLSDPVLVRDVVASSGGCALTRAGDILCRAELGDDGARSEFRPVEGSPRDVVQISGSQDAGCSLSRAGQVSCWGATATERSPGVEGAMVSRPVLGLPPSVLEIVTLGDSACARTESKDVWCWGHLHDVGRGPIEFEVKPWS